MCVVFACVCMCVYVWCVYVGRVDKRLSRLGSTGCSRSMTALTRSALDIDCFARRVTEHTRDATGCTSHSCGPIVWFICPSVLTPLEVDERTLYLGAMHVRNHFQRQPSCQCSLTSGSNNSHRPRPAGHIRLRDSIVCAGRPPTGRPTSTDMHYSAPAPAAAPPPAAASA